ncbi:MAG: branched-chain amino acid ABC transporter permease [Candidatus Limiplasma sp.]|nr:branched-chain amino acid ABC transporter permease [Candidatus Limiplasma sp.]
MMQGLKTKLTATDSIRLKDFTPKEWVVFVLQALVIVAAPLWLLTQPSNSVAFIAFLASLLFLQKIKLPAWLRIVIAALDLVLVMPVVGTTSGTFARVATMIVIYAILAMGLNIVVGYTGLLNLGYAAFYAVGAYLYAIFASTQARNFMPFGVYPMSGNWFWLFLLLAVIVTGFVGFLLGLPVLRLKGDYLAVVTLGFAEIIRLLFNNLSKPINITNGPMGITPIQPPMLFTLKLDRPVHYYLIVLVLFLLTILVVRNLQNSRIGRAWVAIREDELVARTMGVPVVRLKLLSFSIAAGLAGMMGVVFAAMQSYVDPTSFTFMESIVILCMVILGGTGNIQGVIIGALAVVVLQLQILKDVSNYLTSLTTAGILNLPSWLNPAKYERLIFGLILVLMCIFRPNGMLPEKRVLKIRRKLGLGPKEQPAEGDSPAKGGL